MLLIAFLQISKSDQLSSQQNNLGTNVQGQSQFGKINITHFGYPSYDFIKSVSTAYLNYTGLLPLLVKKTPSVVCTGVRAQGRAVEHVVSKTTNYISLSRYLLMSKVIEKQVQVQVLSVHALIVFTIFVSQLMIKSNSKFQLAPLKLLTNFENPSSKPLQRT